jgi:hypothetical protein
VLRAASIAGGAHSRWPLHHGVGLNEHERCAPVRPRLGQYNPKQPIPPPQLRMVPPRLNALTC